MKTKVIVLSLLTIPMFVRTQATLFMNDGKLILGKITKTDSTEVYIDMKEGTKDVQTVINRNEVETIGYFNPDTKDNNSDTSSVYSFSFSAGWCISTGVFASEDVNSDKSGFAGNGLNINLVYTTRVARNLEFTAKGIFNANEFKTEKFIELINTIGNYKFTSSSGKYNFYGLLIGPTIVAGEKTIIFKGSFLFGYGYLKEPEIKFTTTSSTVKKWIKINEISSSSLSYDISASVYVAAYENLYVNVNADYIFGKFVFGTSTVSSSTGASEEYDRGTQHYSVFTISVGIGYTF